MKSKLIVLVVTAAIAGTPSAFAAKNLMSACKKDLKKLGCTANTDADAEACLEKNEQPGKKYGGLSHSCYKAHESYEKKTGKQESGEAHTDSTQKNQ